MTKKIPTTDDAKKKKLPSGTKVRSTQASVNAAARKAVEKMNRTEEFKKKTQSTPIYTADLKAINETLKEIESEIKNQAKSDYAVKNIYIFLQDTLKKIKLSQN